MTKLKQFLVSIIFLVMLIVSNCRSVDHTFHSLDKADIDSIILTTRNRRFEDSLVTKLTATQTAEFIDAIKSAAYIGPSKFLYQYEFVVYDGEHSHLIWATKDLFKLKLELGDQTFKVHDSTLFMRLTSN